jgi:hypothetical protein
VINICIPYIPKRSYGKLQKVNTLKPDKIYVHFDTTKEQTTGMWVDLNKENKRNAFLVASPSLPPTPL